MRPKQQHTGRKLIGWKRRVLQFWREGDDWPSIEPCGSLGQHQAPKQDTPRLQYLDWQPLKLKYIIDSDGVRGCELKTRMCGMCLIIRNFINWTLQGLYLAFDLYISSSFIT